MQSQPKEEKAAEKRLWDRLRRPVLATLGVIALGGTVLGLKSVIKRYPEFERSALTRVVEHDYIPEHSIIDAGVPIKISPEYDLVVEQHQPGTSGADKAGNVQFIVSVSADEYKADQNGAIVYLTDVEADMATHPE